MTKNPRLLGRLPEVDPRSAKFSLRNSWGRGWGRDGSCFVSYADMETLLGSGGEACVPIA